MAWWREVNDENSWAFDSRGPCGLCRRAFIGVMLVEMVSTNVHDKSAESIMTGAFVVGPLGSLLAVIATVIYRSRQKVENGNILNGGRINKPEP
jgi:hypothetical protein